MLLSLLLLFSSSFSPLLFIFSNAHHHSNTLLQLSKLYSLKILIFIFKAIIVDNFDYLRIFYIHLLNIGDKNSLFFAKSINIVCRTDLLSMKSSNIVRNQLIDQKM